MKKNKLNTNKIILCLLVLLLVFLPALSSAQINDEKNLLLSANGLDKETFAVSHELVTQLKKDFNARTDISPEDTARFEAAYTQVVKDLDLIKELVTQKQSFILMQKTAPDDKEQLEKQLADLQKDTSADSVNTDITLPEAESRLVQVQVDFNNARMISSKYENEPQRRAKRVTEIPETISKAAGNLAELNGIIAPTDISAKNGIAYIDFLKNATKSQLYKSQVETLQEELRAYEAAKNVLPLRRELAAKVISSTEKKVEFWQSTVNQIRKKNLQQAKQEAQSAAQQVKYSNEVAKDVALRIGKLTETQADLLKKNEEITQYHRQVSASLNQIKNDFDKTKELIGKTEKVTSTMGMLLLTKKESLPETKQNSKNIKMRFEVISSAQLEWHKNDAQWRGLLDIEALAKELLLGVEITEVSQGYEKHFNELKQYLEQKRNIHSTISGYYLDYLNLLAQLDAEERDLIRIVNKYNLLIEKNILWIKSRSSFDDNQVTNTFIAFRSLFNRNIYIKAVQPFAEDFGGNISAYALVLLLTVLLFGLRVRFKAKILSYAVKIKNAETDRFIYTVNTILLSTVAALPVVIVLIFLLLRYSSAVVPTNVSPEFVNCLKNITIISFMFFLLRWFTMPGGLCSHLKFEKKALAFFRRHSVWFFITIVISSVLYSIFNQLPLQIDIKNAGLRAVFIVEQVFVTAFLFIIFNPKGSILGSMHDLNSSPRIYRLTRLWFILVIIIPSVFCLMSIVGYINAARHLQFNLAKSFLFFLAVLFVNRMILRGLYVSRRRLVLAKFKKQKEDKQTNPDASDIKFDEIHDSILNLSKQSRQIINVVTTFVVLLGFWWIWKSTLPALEAIEQVKIGSTTDSNGEEYVIRLGSTFKAIIIFILTIFTAKNIPGLLEIFILQKLEISSGTRFAFTTMVKYIITIAGVIYACSALGLRWETVQWLVAAVSVGLGFGLQEIFANFISGLIILFEQPVRVGDYVTIGDVSGKVSQIKIRATTIVKWDRKELVVPNKEFITGRLINWTLTDQILRLDFPVGVAYGSDIKKVEETLFKIAGACKKVSQIDPKAKVIFKGFGDSCLDFELRVYINDIEDYLKVWHMINCDIDSEFRKNDIVIAFPQRDLHLKSADIMLPISVDSSSANSAENDSEVEKSPDMDN